VITIAWDVDDVLNDLMRAWLEQWWLPQHADCTARYADLTENPPHRRLGIGRQEYLEALDAFRLSPLAQEMAPAAEVVAWFEEHGATARHLALTAAPLRTAHLSAAWVLRHFGRWIRSFHVIPSPRPGVEAPTYDQTKAEFLRWWGKVDLLVDDHPAHVAAAQQIGIRAVLWPQPWNNARATVAQALAVVTATAQWGAGDEIV